MHSLYSYIKYKNVKRRNHRKDACASSFTGNILKPISL